MHDSIQDHLKGFLNACYTAGPKLCPLSRNSNSTIDLHNQVRDFLEERRNVDECGSDKAAMLEAMAGNFYSPLTQWPVLAAFLDQEMKGNISETEEELSAQLYTEIDDILKHPKLSSLGQGEYLARVRLNDGATGPQHWPQEQEEIQKIAVEFFEKNPFYGRGFSYTTFLSALWDIPKTHSFIPQQNVTTAHPLLIISTSYDHITPLASAKVARDTFLDSRLIEVKGFGHCGISIPSACLVRRFQEFLYNGTLPDDDVRCEADPLLEAFMSEEDEWLAMNEIEGLIRFGDATEEERAVAAVQLVGKGRHTLPKWF